MSKIIPIDDWVVLRPITVRDTSMIVTPDEAKQPTQRYEVLEVGPGRLLDNGVYAKTVVRPGQQIYLGRTTNVEGTWVELEGKKYAMVRECNILGIFQEEGEWPAAEEESRIEIPEASRFAS